MNRLQRVVWGIVVAVCACGAASAGTYSGGAGTALDPYRIGTAADWQELIAASGDWSKNFILLNDIDFDGASLTPVAPDTDIWRDNFQGTPFEGVLDGNNHVLRNAVMSLPDEDCVGLFGCVDGEVLSMGVENVGVTGYRYVGGLCGFNRGTVRSCHIIGTVTGITDVGGLCGKNSEGTIEDCYAMGSVSGGWNEDPIGAVGGLCGACLKGMISGCYATNAVSGRSVVGGLVGYSDDSMITNCYATNTVDGLFWVGGLVGWVTGLGGHYGTITSCYATGTVSAGDTEAGGLVGVNEGRISYCYATGTIYAGATAGGLVGWNPYSGTIIACYASGTIGRGSFNGGLVADNGGLIESCYATGDISGRYYLGGLVGRNYYGRITASYTTGVVSGSGDHVGGLVGRNEYGTLTACYATGAVTGSQDVGGLAGFNLRGTISNCYATGAITGDEAETSVGGLVGANDAGTITACFWDMQTSGRATSQGGTGSTTPQMQTLSTFTDAAWDFVGETGNGTLDVWRMCVEGVVYPRLSWEFSRHGDLDCPDGVGMVDFAYLARRWMANTPETAGAADANGDGEVGIEDFAILAESWLQ